MKRELKQRERLWQEATGHCIYCGHPVSLEEMEADHIVPRSRGGENGFANKVCSCPACNALKGDATLEDFLRNHFNDSQLQKYLNRVDTLAQQGKMTWEKAWDLSAPAMDAHTASRAPEPQEEEAAPGGSLCFFGGLLYVAR